jgi:transketolase
MVHEFARRDSRVVFIGSDLGAGTLDKLRAELPGQFFMEGVNEASIIGMASGLAAEGHIVYVNTIAVFITRRAYEQVALDLCLPARNVRLIGSGGGLVYAPLGPTHMAIEDLALMRALPNMTVIAPADAREMRRMMLLVEHHPGPVYIRLGKGNEPDITPEDLDLELGVPYLFRPGTDALFITTGVTLHTAAAAAELLAGQGIEAGILHCPAVKPLDAEAVLAAIERVPVTVAVEEHVRAGGLGSAVAELVAEAPSSRPRFFRQVGLPDEFPEHYGSQADLLQHYGITPEALAGHVMELTMKARAAGL